MRLPDLLVAVVCLGLLPSVAPAADITLPDGPGRDLVYARCRTCHDLQYLVESEGIPASAWKDILVTMYGFGLRIPDDEKTKIAAYLGTYLGPNPPPATPPAAPPAALTAAVLDGKALFEANCSSCHQADGKGVPGSFPPLAGNTDLFLDRLYPVRVVLHGLQGKVTVEGKSFDGVMPDFGHLEDVEIAAILNYVRGGWGNAANRPADMADLTAADVKRLRGKDMTPDDVYAMRASLLKK